MCTIVALHRTHPDHPLVIAANRDEHYARAAAPPAVIVLQTNAVGGRDLEAGGTWLGATEAGFFIGLTNQRTFDWAAPKAPRSRGEIPVEALRRGSVAGVRALLAALPTAAYKAFNLVYGDGETLEVAYVRPTGFETVALAPGVHVLTNDRMGSPDFPKEAKVRALVRGDASEAELERMLADRSLPDLDRIPDPPPPIPKEFVRELQAICIRTPTYGTRSSTVIALRPGRITRYLFADGPPDVTPFVDVLPLFGATP